MIDPLSLLKLAGKALKVVKSDKAQTAAGIIDELTGNGDGSLSAEQKIELEREITRRHEAEVKASGKNYLADLKATEKAIGAFQKAKNPVKVALAFILAFARPQIHYVAGWVFIIIAIGFYQERIDQTYLPPYLATLVGYGGSYIAAKSAERIKGKRPAGE